MRRAQGIPTALRSQVNRVVLVAVLAVVLPAIALAERRQAGAGRAVAVRAILRVGRLCRVRFEVRGAARLDDQASYVLVPNHTSPVDIAAVLVARPDARFVAAAELFRIPLLGAAMRALDTVPIRRGDVKGAHARIAELSRPEEDRELVMFPEGGISSTATLQPFKTGAFVVAIAGAVPVVPVAIRGAADVLPPRARLRLRPGTVRVDVLEPVPTDGLRVEDRRFLADLARERVERALAT